MGCQAIRLADIPILSALLASATATGWTQVYCNVTNVEVKGLANGVQITIQADGLLEWEPADRDYERWWNMRENGTSELTVRFPAARSKLDDNFIDVSIPPVSYVQVSIPQDAQQGIGLQVKIVLSEHAKFEHSIPPDRQSFILMFHSERTIERSTAAEPKFAVGAVEEVELEVRCENGLVSVRATNADIHKVIGEVAHQAGINVAVDDAVKHKVSLRLQNLDPLAVLRGIASGYGLALSTDGDVIMISEGVPRDMATYNRSETASFPMRYLRAGEAQGLLPTFLFSYLHANMEQNAVVVTAPSQMLEKIENDLERVDVPPPIVMVEVLAVELTDTQELTSGLYWKYFGTSDIAGTDPRAGSIEYRIIGPDDFIDPEGVAITRTRDLAINLDALLAKGQAKIRANPRMAAVNGQEAEIFIGAQRFIKVNFLQYGQQQERIQSVPVGVRLTVTPWTGGNREITSHLVAEVSNIVEIDPQSGLPLLSTRRTESTVRAADGETIFIGGLTQEQEEIRRKKIPMLGDLPILGSLFRHTTKTSVNTELVLLVTPRLLTEEGQLPDAAEEEALRREFLRPGDFGAVNKDVIASPPSE
ncbi:MAG: type II secretion system protein GspD [Candidatus Zipacnadales bacterium]